MPEYSNWDSSSAAEISSPVQPQPLDSVGEPSEQTTGHTSPSCNDSEGTFMVDEPFSSPWVEAENPQPVTDREVLHLHLEASVQGPLVLWQENQENSLGFLPVGDESVCNEPNRHIEIDTNNSGSEELIVDLRQERNFGYPHIETGKEFDSKVQNKCLEGFAGLNRGFLDLGMKLVSKA